MSDKSDDESDSDVNNRKVSQRMTAITEHCGIRARLHECEATERAIKADLADEDLLESAQGGIPSSVRMIIDVPVDIEPRNPEAE